MLSAFVSIPAVKMDWIIKTTGVVLAKTAVNAVAPGMGSIVDFAQAANDLWQGDKMGALINVASGVVDICTFGVSSSVKEAMKKGAKESTKEGAKVMGKKAGKEATKKFGRQVGRQLAQETFQGGKDAAIKYAPALADQVRKKATKEFGKRLGKDIARGLIPESVEKVYNEATKMLLDDLCRKVMSTGGNDVAKGILKEYFEDVIQLVISQVMKKNPTLAFEFAKIAEEGALKEFAKHIWKITAKDLGVACAKGAINRFSNNNIPIIEDEQAMIIVLEIIKLRS